jgi:hypothetical protein
MLPGLLLLMAAVRNAAGAGLDLRHHDRQSGTGG